MNFVAGQIAGELQIRRAEILIARAEQVLAEFGGETGAVLDQLVLFHPSR